MKRCTVGEGSAAGDASLHAYFQPHTLALLTHSYCALH